MLLTKYMLVFITMTLFCVTTSVWGGKLNQSQDVVNVTEDTASTKSQVSKTEATAGIKATEIKSSEEDDNDDDDDHDDDDEAEDHDSADNEIEAVAEKNAIQPAADTSLSAWSIISGLWNWIREDISESLFGSDGKTSAAVGEGRTFGKIRRLQMALIPIVFKFGVLSAMIVFLVGLGIKTLFLVKVLIVMNLLALLAKFFTLKSNFGHVEHFATHPAPLWSPYMGNGWHSTPEEHHINKEIHLHIHGGHLQPHEHSYGNIASAKSQGWERRNDPYGAYEAIELQEQHPSELLPKELTTVSNAVAGSGQQLRVSVPGNHRIF